MEPCPNKGATCSLCCMQNCHCHLLIEQYSDDGPSEALHGANHARPSRDSHPRLSCSTLASIHGPINQNATIWISLPLLAHSPRWVCACGPGSCLLCLDAQSAGSSVVPDASALQCCCALCPRCCLLSLCRKSPSTIGALRCKDIHGRQRKQYAAASSGR